jgi:hypothetical protein
MEDGRVVEVHRQQVGGRSLPMAGEELSKNALLSNPPLAH